MTGPTRLQDKTGPFGRLIDRSKPQSFTFNGKRMKGFAGDTLASALLANGVGVVARSFKYHRPRGVFSIGADEPNAIVEVGTGDRRTPNLLATGVMLHDGLVARSQNAWPSLRFDAASMLDLARPILPAGFQHKTFKRPLKAWRVYERAVRKIAGLGKAPVHPDPDRYEHVHAHADVLVVGGGIAGLAAAEAAADAGLRVFLAESSHRLGGISDGYDGRIDNRPLLDWMRSKAVQLAATGNVHLLTQAQVAGLYDHGLALIVETLAPAAGSEAGNMPRERLWKLRAKSIVLATGAFEKPLVFPDNDRPGIMLATSARLYLRRHAVSPGQRVAIATTGDEGYRTAVDLVSAGVDVARVIDLRLAPNGSLFHIAKSRGQPITIGSAPVASKGKRFGGQLSALTIANRLTLDGPALKTELDCDALLVSGGWAPAANLAGHLGAKLRFDAELGGFRPGDLPGGLFVAGSANAKFEIGAVVEDGWRAGAEAALHVRGEAASQPRKNISVEVTEDDVSEAVGDLPDIATTTERLRAFVDLQTDVTVGDMQIAVREGYGAPELLKRYAGLSLGTDQGKSSVANMAAILPRLARTDAVESTHTTFRPPWTPVTLGTIAGARRGPLFRPTRFTPLSGQFDGAMTEPAGPWNLPPVFPEIGEAQEAAVRREVTGIRNGLGIFDASAGAQILIAGPDAEIFLNRMSATDLLGIAVGRSRYALFLDEAGFLMEDGIVGRLSGTRYLLSFGMGRGTGMAAWFERWHQQAFHDLDVFIIDETERWAGIVLAGPRVPDLLSRVDGDIDISSFAADSIAEGEIFGGPARALATRYTAGPEVELSVASGFAAALWDYLIEAGRESGLTRFGTDTMHRLRLEAGAFNLDRETDGSVTPFDLGLGDLVSTTKAFVGRAGLERPALTRPHRRHLVGVLMDDRTRVPPPGAHLVLSPDQAAPRRVVGHITSSGYSPTLRRSLALALVSAGKKHIGDQVFIVMSGGGHAAKITTTDFLSAEAQS